jgi:hypothetical protein
LPLFFKLTLLAPADHGPVSEHHQSSAWVPPRSCECGHSVADGAATSSCALGHTLAGRG